MAEERQNPNFGARRGGKNQDRHGGMRHDGRMYDGVCCECGAPVQVPFKPLPGRNLYCKSCFQAHGGVRPELGESGEDGARREKPRYEIVCSHCGKRDTVSFKPFEGSAVLCRECMENPNIERVGGKVLHTIICAVCGKECKVPFKPEPGSRVLCRECHIAEREKKAQQRAYFAKHHPNVVHNTKVRVDIRCERCGCEDTLPFVPKTNGPILCRQCAENLFGDEWAKRNRVGASEYPFTCSRCGAQDFVPFKPSPDRQLLCKHCLNDQAVLKHRREEMSRHDAFTCVRAHHDVAVVGIEDPSKSDK